MLLDVCHCNLYPFVADWDTSELAEEKLLDTVSRFLLAALIKHGGLVHLLHQPRYCTESHIHVYILIDLNLISFNQSLGIATAVSGKLLKSLTTLFPKELCITESSVVVIFVSGRTHLQWEREALSQY